MRTLTLNSFVLPDWNNTIFMVNYNDPFLTPDRAGWLSSRFALAVNYQKITDRTLDPSVLQLQWMQFKPTFCRLLLISGQYVLLYLQCCLSSNNANIHWTNPLQLKQKSQNRDKILTMDYKNKQYRNVLYQKVFSNDSWVQRLHGRE